jgi:hypothetical protein
MMSRKRLPDRRHSEILELELHGLRNTASFSRFAARCPGLRVDAVLGAALDCIAADRGEQQ